MVGKVIVLALMAMAFWHWWLPFAFVVAYAIWALFCPLGWCLIGFHDKKCYYESAAVFVCYCRRKDCGWKEANPR